jgi:hypothetical protein
LDADATQRLETFRVALHAHATSARDLAASEIGDHLEYARDLPNDLRTALVALLLQAAPQEHDVRVLESILNALAIATATPHRFPDLPWQQVGALLPRLSPPLLSYGLEILGACGDPAMARYVRPYQQHARATIRNLAGEALDQLAREPTSAEVPCACAGCGQPALPDGQYCPYCEDHHYHTHEPPADASAE